MVATFACAPLYKITENSDPRVNAWSRQTCRSKAFQACACLGKLRISCSIEKSPTCNRSLMK